jgi:hypothetical protein
MKKRYLTGIVVLFIMLGTAVISEAKSVIHMDLTSWEAAVSNIEVLVTTADNVALADEITSVPGLNSKLGGMLTYQSVNTGLSRGFTIESLQGITDPTDPLYDKEQGFTFNDMESGISYVIMHDALSVGDSDDFEDDDWRLTLLDDAAIVAFGIDISHSRFTDGESISLYSNDTLIDTIDLSSLPDMGNADQFIGIISDVPFDRIDFNEDPDSDDIGIADFRFATAAFASCTDNDGDLYGSGPGTDTCVASGTGSDCDDGNTAIHPGGLEIPYDGVDQNCSGSDLTDIDGDGLDSTDAGGTDCDDNDATVYPGAEEVCNGRDDNCDGSVDEGFPDADEDGFSTCEGDCDDANGAINPDATEVCDGVDNDCNDGIDEGLTTTYYEDSDNDTYGNDAVSQEACSQPVGYVTDNNDCNDGDGNVNPDAAEVCDGVDNDCDGGTVDGSGETAPLNTLQDGVCADSLQSCTEGSWTDDYSGVSDYEETETLCDGLDNDCDSLTDNQDGDAQCGGSDDVIIDFGSSEGLRGFYNNATWETIHTLDPEVITTGNVDGDLEGRDDVIIDFGASVGIWVLYNDSSWGKIHNASPEIMATGNIDGDAGGRDDIIFDLSWEKIHSASPEIIATGNIDGDAGGRDDIIFDFGPSAGVWVLYNDSSWEKIHNVSPEIIATGNIDGDAGGRDDIIFDFGSSAGVWVLYNDSSWGKIHNASPEIITTGNIDGDAGGRDDIIFDFGLSTGVWVINDSSWGKIHNASPEIIATGNIDGDAGGKDDVIIDFGPSAGVWVMYNDSSWSNISDLSPEGISSEDMDGN